MSRLKTWHEKITYWLHEIRACYDEMRTLGPKLDAALEELIAFNERWRVDAYLKKHGYRYTQLPDGQWAYVEPDEGALK